VQLLTYHTDQEALWINFEAQRPFAVKIYVGDINAISGEQKVEIKAGLNRRRSALEHGRYIQDYIVAGPGSQNQKWVDGIYSNDGKVRQFVATPSGSGFSVESQLMETDVVGGGLQFEIVP
jgi:hypothetical protein